MLLLDFLLSLGSLGLLAAGSSPLRQRIGDRIAQTVVIKSKRHSLYQLDDILNIKSVNDHKVMYTKATELTVEQALLLKELIVRWDKGRNDELRGILEQTAQELTMRLQLGTNPPRQLEFIRQVLRDYIVLTR